MPSGGLRRFLPGGGKPKERKKREQKPRGRPQPKVGEPGSGWMLFEILEPGGPPIRVGLAGKGGSEFWLINRTVMTDPRTGEVSDIVGGEFQSARERPGFDSSGGGKGKVLRPTYSIQKGITPDPKVLEWFDTVATIIKGRGPETAERIRIATETAQQERKLEEETTARQAPPKVSADPALIQAKETINTELKKGPKTVKMRLTLASGESPVRDYTVRILIKEEGKSRIPVLNIRAKGVNWVFSIETEKANEQELLQTVARALTGH